MSFSAFSLSSYQFTNKTQRDKNILRNTWHAFIWALSLIYKISLGMILITRYYLSPRLLQQLSNLFISVFTLIYSLYN